MKFQSQHYSKLHKDNNIIYNNHQSSKSELKQQKVVKRSKIGDVTKLYVLLAEAAGIFYTFAEFTSRLTKWIIPV